VKYNIVFHYHLEVEADSKERAEELACDDYRLNQPPQLDELSITVEQKETV
jgi:hypothetical protein|tara:strand:+ start:176 stop:328 length:153 start_codon:yes stop_codon:yes gene_type:complete